MPWASLRRLRTQNLSRLTLIRAEEVISALMKFTDSDECGDFETIPIVRRQWLNVICERLWYIALSHSQPFRLTFRSAPQRDVTGGQGACIIFKAILHNLGSAQTSDTALEAVEFSTALDMCQTG